MNYEAVFNVFLGMLALLGCTPVILFLIVFREQKTIHPIYRSVATLADPDSKRADRIVTSHAGRETSYDR